MMQVKQRADYTFKYNKNLERHGWLRLTPAYSVKLVKEIVQQTKLEQQNDVFILDPFSGTATTGLVAAQAGFSTCLYDINPFLIWLGNAKCANYSQHTIDHLRAAASRIITDYKPLLDDENWAPKIHNIGRWWSRQTLRILKAIRSAILSELGEPQQDHPNALVWIAFCRLVIDTSAAAFNHVSMSFHDDVTTYATQTIDIFFSDTLNTILKSAEKPVVGNARVHQGDSRFLQPNGLLYTHVITSPPYPNRISYIRELRPYMYWTKFLHEAREAGELDWAAIGGTWGIATSRLKDWQLERDDLPQELFPVCRAIERSDNKNAFLMSQYVCKYFHDMHQHFDTMRETLAPGAKLYYIVGNATFYGVHVDTETLLSLSLRRLGYQNIKKRVVRKRNSKKELFEYCLSATWL